MTLTAWNNSDIFMLLLKSEGSVFSQRIQGMVYGILLSFCLLISLVKLKKKKSCITLSVTKIL